MCPDLEPSGGYFQLTGSDSTDLFDFNFLSTGFDYSNNISFSTDLSDLFVTNDGWPLVVKLSIYVDTVEDFISKTATVTGGDGSLTLTQAILDTSKIFYKRYNLFLPTGETTVTFDFVSDSVGTMSSTIELG